MNGVRPPSLPSVHHARDPRDLDPLTTVLTELKPVGGLLHGYPRSTQLSPARIEVVRATLHVLARQVKVSTQTSGTGRILAR